MRGATPITTEKTEEFWTVWAETKDVGRIGLRRNSQPGNGGSAWMCLDPQIPVVLRELRFTSVEDAFYALADVVSHPTRMRLGSVVLEHHHMVTELHVAEVPRPGKGW